MGNEQELMKSFMEVASMGKDLKQLKAEVDELKTEKATLERSVNVLKTGVADGNSEHNKKIQEHKDEISRLDKIIESKKTEVNTQTINLQGEINKHNKAEKDANDAIAEQNKISEQNIVTANNLSKKESGLNTKLELIKQIKGLASKL